MRVWRFLHIPSVEFAILRCASWLVPSQQRVEWLAEWRAELWHVLHGDDHSPDMRPSSDVDATAFCLGAFQDAFWLRRHSPPSEVQPWLPWKKARQCVIFLAVLAAANLIIALLVPGVRSALRRSPYQDANSLVLISRRGYLHAVFPTISIEKYRTWKLRKQTLFTDFAFYQPILSVAESDQHRTMGLSVAVASDNLFDLLKIQLSSTAIEEARRTHRPTVVLSQAAWHRYFNGDTHVVGRDLEVGGQQAVIAAVLSDDAWKLPGQMDAWLLEDDHDLAALQPKSMGFVLGHLTKAELATNPPGWWHIFDQEGPGSDDFDCVSLMERIQQPTYNFLFMLMLACLALPATTPLSLGEYPATRDSLFAATRWRRWRFLLVKIALILPIVYCGSLTLAYLNPSLSALTSDYIQLFTSFTGLLFSFRWALRDQRQRCPECLCLLINPARVGEPSRNFLAWNGTEMMCSYGHGLLHIPEIATSWFSTQRWLQLDPSWKSLFQEGYLPNAGIF